MESTAGESARSTQSAARPRRTFLTLVGALLLVVLSMITVHLQGGTESTSANTRVSVATETPSALAEAENEAAAGLSAEATAPENPGLPLHVDWMTLCFLAILATLALFVLPHRRRSLTVNVARGPAAIQPIVVIPRLPLSPRELSVISRT